MIKYATNITSTTLLGIIEDEYPLSRGNCFGVEVENKDYSIVNFYVENLEHLLKEKIINWPIKIKILENHIAVIHDSRIPDEYYNERFCTVCCPEDLLPITQRLLHERQEDRGERIVKEVNGMKIICYNYKANPKPLGWTYSLDSTQTNEDIEITRDRK